MSTYTEIYERYNSLKSEREQYNSLWQDIADFVGITVDLQYQHTAQDNKSRPADQYINDPTAAISVNQFGDYLLGIMWGTGAKAFRLKPSRYVLEKIGGETSQQILEKFYAFVTDQTLYHMNHSDAGLSNCLRAYAYDQAAFGNSGVGAFPNKDFLNGKGDNAIVFRQYGVDNTCIDEGRAGLVEYVFATYHWRVSRIIGEFCMKDGIIDKEAVSGMPKEIKEAWSNNQFNKEFNIVFGFFPREDYDPRLKGKRGTKYKGVWFQENAKDGKFFYEEDFAERPVAFCRMIKVRGEVYGRSSGTLLISSIKAVDFMTTTVIEAVEKMINPALGMSNNAMFGDSVLDTSPNSLSIFKSDVMQGGNPIFPLHDIGDPRGLIEFLIPYLNEKIATAFKIDSLLDFSSAKDMTATESMQRYAIRGKSLSGLLQQQKSELLEPLTKRCISILMMLNQLGIDPSIYEEQARKFSIDGLDERVIPDPVIKCIKEGRGWFDIEFNNELEKLTRTEEIQGVAQVLQYVGGIAAMYPQIIEAIDWYQMLNVVNENLGANNQILLTAEDFKKKLQQQAQQQQAAMALQAGQMGASMNKDNAIANKTNKEAMNG